MKKVILRGPALTQSGYGVHCRQVAKWLLSKDSIDLKFQALPWGDTPWLINSSKNELIEKIMKKTIDLSESAEKKFDVSFQLQLPNEWDSTLASYNVGMTAAVETDICNTQWVEACNKMDMIVVPSKHAAECITRSGNLMKPIVVIPESYCEEIDLDDVESTIEKLPKFSTGFNFLIFGQITGDNPMNDRKNIFFTIKWLCEAFENDPDVGIIIKTNMGRNTCIDKKKSSGLIKAIIKECRKESFPKIHLLHGEMPDTEVAALYKHPQVKALVSTTRGEGYGLPILEAAASGLPVIATGWSGHTDFLNHGKYIGLSYALRNIHSSRVDNRIFMKDAKWAEVHEEDFKKKIIKFRNSSSAPKEWAVELSKKIKQNYCFDAVCKEYDETFKDHL